MRGTRRGIWVAVAAGISLASLVCGQESKASGSVWESRKSAWEQLAPGQKEEVFRFAEGYKSYLNVARSALTSTHEVMRLARATGFSEFTDASQVKPGARLIVNGRDRAVILVVVGSEPIVSGSRLIGTHHDSPHIDLKARPIYASNGYTLFKTIYYGGIKKYQWANRPLALIGRIDTVDGKRVDVAIGLKDGDPVFAIPDNAPHSDNKEILNRKDEEIFGGEELDPVAGSVPGKDASVTAAVLAALTSTYGIREEDFVSAELQLVPAASPADVGIDRGLVGAYGQDDRLSSYCAARAVMDVRGTPKHTAMAYLSNFEEVGSVNNTGARSEFLNSTYARLVAAERGKAYSDLDLRLALRALRGRLRRHERRHQPGLSADERALRGRAARLRRDDQAIRRGLRRELRVHREDPGPPREERHRLADADAEGGRLLRRHDRRVPLGEGDGGHRHGRAAPLDARALRDVLEGRRLELLPLHGGVPGV